MPVNVLVLHGPNLALHREGGRTLESLDAELVARAQALGAQVKTCAANAEGALLDELHRQRDWCTAVLVNPSSLAPVAYGLADALELLGKPAVEVLLGHESKGRGRSALRFVVEKQFHGRGFDGYLKALEALVKAPAAASSSGAAKVEKTVGPKAAGGAVSGGDARREKTIGKKGRAPEVNGAEAGGRAGKSIGKRSGGGEASARAAAPTSGGITRSLVRAKLAERLQKKTSPEAFAAWAQAQYQALKSGAAIEAGQEALLEDTLLLLAASARMGDELLITTLAKLDV